eukprot:scaffold1229_cov68-Cylindrotheca_fusiformis.AAC.1
MAPSQMFFSPQFTSFAGLDFKQSTIIVTDESLKFSHLALVSAQIVPSEEVVVNNSPVICRIKRSSTNFIYFDIRLLEQEVPSSRFHTRQFTRFRHNRMSLCQLYSLMVDFKSKKIHLQRSTCNNSPDLGKNHKLVGRLLEQTIYLEVPTCDNSPNSPGKITRVRWSISKGPFATIRQIRGKLKGTSTILTYECFGSL